MLSKHPPYFSCVMACSNYAIFLLVTVLSTPSAGRVIFHVLNTSIIVMTNSAVASALAPLCYHDYLSATWASTCSTYSQHRNVEAPCSILYVAVTWMGAAHIICPGLVSTVQTLASVNKDHPQPSLT